MLSQDLQTIEVNIDAGVAWMVLNRPEGLNAWTRQLGEDLLAALDSAEADPEVRAVVITGAGRAFSSGADLKGGFELGDDGKLNVLAPLREAYNPVMLRVRTLPKPVVAAVNGPAVGIGCSLALACDLILAAESAYFLLAFVNIGLGVDGGASLTLPLRVGQARALELMMLGERLGAVQALDWGLVNQVVADAELHQTAATLAARLAGGPPGSFATIKQTVNAGLFGRFGEVLDLEAVLQQERAGTADFMEGVMAFMQKRPAKFTGA